jgi:Pan3 Pseudokinase domain
LPALGGLASRELWSLLGPDWEVAWCGLAGRGLTTWQGLCNALSDRAYAELEAAQLHSDALLGEVAKEAENGRLLRLLTRLSFVNERPELEGDPRWAETGARPSLCLGSGLS